MPLAPVHQSSSSPRLPLAPIHQASFHHSSSSPGMLVHPSGVPLTKFAVPEHSGVQYQPGVLYSHMDGADLGGSSGIYSAKFIDAEEEVSGIEIIGASNIFLGGGNPTPAGTVGYSSRHPNFGGSARFIAPKMVMQEQLQQQHPREHMPRQHQAFATPGRDISSRVMSSVDSRTAGTGRTFKASTLFLPEFSPGPSEWHLVAPLEEASSEASSNMIAHKSSNSISSDCSKGSSGSSSNENNSSKNSSSRNGGASKKSGLHKFWASLLDGDTHTKGRGRKIKSESNTPSPEAPAAPPPPLQQALIAAVEHNQSAENIDTGDIENTAVAGGTASIEASAAIENKTAIIEASTAIEATEAAPSSTPRGDSVGTAGDDGGLNADTAANANRGHWREDEVIELVKAHVELDPEYHIMRGVQGSNYYGELYRILRAKFPDFRHTEGSVKTKLFRLKGQYLQLRDRIERSASAAPRNLPEWFVLLDTVMARESSNRQTATAANQQSSRITHPSTNSGRMAALLTNAGQERKLLSAETPAYAFPVTPTWLDTAGQSGLTRNSLFQNVASTPEPPVSAPPPPPATISPFAGGGGSGSYLLSLRNSITPVPTRETGRLRMGTGGFGEGRKKRGAAARGAGMLSGPEASIAAAMAEKFAAAMGSAVRNACFQFEELTRELLENSCSQFEELSARLAENAAAQFEDVARELAANFVANQDVKRRRR
ncbi:unnamed protein product [Closterium sp. NIES-54]